MNVLDVSAILAFLQGEAGVDVTEAALAAGAACGAATWSEVAQKVLAHGRNWDLVRALLASYDMAVEPVTAGDGEWAAHRWRRARGCRSLIDCASPSPSASTPLSGPPTRRGAPPGESARFASSSASPLETGPDLSASERRSGCGGAGCSGS